MRAQEFITENGKLKKASREALPHTKNYPEIDSAYGLYRFGIGMASAPDNTDGHETGPIGINPSIVMYSDAEEEIVRKAEKALNIKGKALAKKGPSSEMSHINTTSPVANWNKK